jgi:hypothetical protein
MKKKPYWEMTTEELAAATERFEKPSTIEQSRPLTPAERQQWDRLKRKRGRPRVGQGFKRISLSIEQGLLQQVTAVAKKKHVTRSKLIAMALEKVLSEEKKTR